MNDVNDMCDVHDVCDVNDVHDVCDVMVTQRSGSTDRNDGED
ncbi:hypothetical protein [Streptomyces sp. VRA16 Mangrove soil]|nr:hypothetical protein [Streptomyces sp. VRA16 Mangrove soil]